MTAQLHTVADIHANPALFGADLAQPDLTVAQRFFLAAEGTQLFPGNAAATANFGNWFNSAAQLNGFGDGTIQSIVAHNTPTSVAAFAVTAIEAAGGTPGFVNSAFRATDTSQPDTSSFTWAGTFVEDNYSNAGDEAVGVYAQGNGFASSPTWGGVDEVVQHQGGTGTIVGLEVDTRKDFLTPGQEFGIDIVSSSASPNGLAAPMDGAIRVPDGVPALTDSYGDAIEFQQGHVLILIGGHVLQDFHV